MKFIILAALVAVAVCGEVKLKDCGHNEVTKVEVDDCSGDFCVVHKSKPLHFRAEFVANQDTSKIEVKVTGSLNGLEVQIPGIETDGCKVLKCPLKKGQKYSFDYTFKIPSIVPTIKSTITFKAFGDHGPISCVKMAGEVKP